LGKSKRVATSSGSDLEIHKIFDKATREWIYFVVDKTFPLEKCPKRQSNRPHPVVIGFCAMVKQPRWVAHETVMLYVSPESRGRGIATILYDGIMKDGVIVMSGYSHNPKSRNLWMKIVSTSTYITWAHDIVNLDRYSSIEVIDGKFRCDLKLYEDIKKIRRRRKQDVRIIAYNPRYLRCTT
jgi:hypothetical protein